MLIPVGPHRYELILVKGFIDHQGMKALGLCDSSGQRILISDQAPPTKRISTFWHELAHAWKRELDIHEASALEDEPMANLMALAMAYMDQMTIARMVFYLTHGVDCPQLLFIPGRKEPIPVFGSISEVPPAWV